MTEPWPYNLPIFRRAHRAVSPDTNTIAEIDPAYEVGMSNPTCGTLKMSNGLQLDRCNPSFIWSDDSRYLAVPQFFTWFGLFRRQRMVVIDTIERAAFASSEIAYYYQPESFFGGLLVVTKEPFRKSGRNTWQLPEDFTRFQRITMHVSD